MAAVRDHFKPEFLNRVDEIVVFHRLSEADIERIVDIQVEQLARPARRARARRSSSRRRAQQWIAQTGYDPDFGARPLKRVLQREVADPIALELLKGDYQPTATRSSSTPSPTAASCSSPPPPPTSSSDQGFWRHMATRTVADGRQNRD